MKDLQINTNPEVEMVFENYPNLVRNKISNLRRLILEVAKEVDEITNIEETLKWGEPSYLVKKGSTIRIDWKKKKKPDQYGMYFKCTSKLVPTFSKVFTKKFEFEGDRAIIFKMDDKLPEEELRKCIKVALTYHKIKHLNLLGL